MSPLPGQSSNQPLPSKELGYFRKIVKCYEQKQYKAGLKFAKQILSNNQFSEHGETLAMKGLILNSIGKHAEAQECVKRGLKSDLGSYVCWHVYGLLQRSEKKFDEAIKAYKRALMLDKDNLQILRDLSLLQIQFRDYEGYLSTRYELLRLRQTQRVCWIGYITAHHLLKEYDKALAVMGEFIKNNTPTGYDYEHSELVLYQNMILRESGQIDVALQKLEENAAHIVDRAVYMETRAQLLMDLDQPRQAENVWRQLIDRNPDCLEYYTKLVECTGVQDDEAARLELFDDIAEKHKRALAPRRLALYIVEGKQLRNRLHAWMTPMLRKGAPSLFASLLPLYKFPDKVAVIESLINEYVKKMDDEGYNNVSLDDNNEIEPPSTALWLYVLAAQHFDRIGNIQLALNYIERAIQHTPTLVENLMLKARIYKHAGEYEEAARLMDEAQSLDTADRYINSKCGKYMLRAKRLDDAEKMLVKFTREGEKASISLTDMQCMWYEIECGRAHRALNKYGDALKRAHHVEFHFLTMLEDQYDFHTYCLRKMTLTAYIRMLRMEDVIRKNNYYYAAAKLAIKIYLRMLDRPQDMNEENGLIKEGMTENEIKKLKKKLKKQKEQKEQEEELKKKEKEKEDDSITRGPQFDAEALLKTDKPLDEAAKFAHHLHMLGTEGVTGYALCAEVYRRKNKVLLALKCLNEGNKKESNHPLLHVEKVKFLLYWKECQCTGLVKETAESVVKAIFGNDTDPKKFNEKYHLENSKLLAHRMAYAEAMFVYDPAGAEKTMKSWLLKSTNDEGVTGRTLKMLIKLRDGINYGRYGKWTSQEIEELRKVAHSLYPLSIEFGGGLVKPKTSEVKVEHHEFK
ncbi:unnamed protein product [Caenorhabditis bovis]|uniref:N-alpha-acetyltransferase 15, NatA auxiliary subunit n=1 Tax=Caenorhabditis bovis TaxID=2654633 RepID=A0A8S1ELX0_9PELO|nr:unnamed protein product [Caenorhabditis bovis]